MSRSNPKQVPRACTLVYKPTQRASARVTHPTRSTTSYDLEPGFEFLRSLIEARVIERLEKIFEQVRRLETLGIQKAQRRAIRLREVLRVLGIGKSTLYARLNPTSPTHDPDMPRPFKLGNSDRSPSVWWHHEVQAYLEFRAELQRAN